MGVEAARNSISYNPKWWFWLFKSQMIIWLGSSNNFWLVVWLPLFIFPSIKGIVIPTDELIFFRGVESTNQIWVYHSLWESWPESPPYSSMIFFLGDLCLVRGFPRELCLIVGQLYTISDYIHIYIYIYIHIYIHDYPKFSSFIDDLWWFFVRDFHRFPIAST